jgi:hypothetical protein
MRLAQIPKKVINLYLQNHYQLFSFLDSPNRFSAIPAGGTNPSEKRKGEADSALLKHPRGDMKPRTLRQVVYGRFAFSTHYNWGFAEGIECSAMQE